MSMNMGNREYQSGTPIGNCIDYHELVYPIGINIFPIGYSLCPIGGAGPGAGPARSAWPSLRGPRRTAPLAPRTDGPAAPARRARPGPGSAAPIGNRR